MGESTTIVHALLTIAALLLAAIFAVTVLGRLGFLQSTLSDLIRSKTEIIQTNVKIVSGFYNESEDAYVIYVKNIGNRPITQQMLNNTDIYLGTYGAEVKLYRYGDGSVGTWTATDLNGDGIWSSGETLIIKVYTGSEVQSPVYVKIVLPTGFIDEEIIVG